MIESFDDLSKLIDAIDGDDSEHLLTRTDVFAVEHDRQLRASWAARAILAYNDRVSGDLDTIIPDLLCDLMQLSDFLLDQAHVLEHSSDGKHDAYVTMLENFGGDFEDWLHTAQRYHQPESEGTA